MTEAVTASRALVAEDCGKRLIASSGSTITLTIPTGLELEFRCEVERNGAGAVTIAASGTTLHSIGGLLNVSAQYGVAVIQGTSADTFTVSGNLS